MYAIFNFTDVVILIWLIYIFCIFFNFNIKIETLFEMMSNRKLTTIKQQMQEHILQFGDQARIDILNMLKQQNIIERNDKSGSLKL